MITPILGINIETERKECFNKIIKKYGKMRIELRILGRSKFQVTINT